MQALLAAIDARFTAASLISTITGGIGLNEIPRGAAMPYAIARPVTAPVTQLYGSPWFSDCTVDFLVRGVGANATLVLAQAMRDAYLNQILTIASGQMINTVLVFDCIPEPGDPEPDESGNDSFGWIFSMRFTCA